MKKRDMLCKQWPGEIWIGMINVSQNILKAKTLIATNEDNL